MRINEMPISLFKRITYGVKNTKYANPEWIGIVRGREKFDNNTMFSLYIKDEITIATRLEF